MVCSVQHFFCPFSSYISIVYRMYRVCVCVCVWPELTLNHCDSIDSISLLSITMRHRSYIHNTYKTQSSRDWIMGLTKGKNNNNRRSTNCKCVVDGSKICPSNDRQCKHQTIRNNISNWLSAVLFRFNSQSLNETEKKPKQTEQK